MSRSLSDSVKKARKIVSVCVSIAAEMHRDKLLKQLQENDAICERWKKLSDISNNFMFCSTTSIVHYMSFVLPFIFGLIKI